MRTLDSIVLGSESCKYQLAKKIHQQSKNIFAMCGGDRRVISFNIINIFKLGSGWYRVVGQEKCVAKYQ